MDVLDVGQGDSILIRTPAQKAILIDAGGGEINVPKLLEALGVTSLDLVVATHPHADHIGGMDDVLAALPVKNYIDNALPHTTRTYEKVMTLVEGKEMAYRGALAGMSFKLDDGVVFEVLFPNGTKLANTRSDLNSNSVVTRLTHGKNCFLFTGDSEEPTERALLAAGMGRCDVLKVAHHGSNHSSSTAFLEAVHPSIALISVGSGNRYGHPGDETLARLQAVGTTIYRTDLMGAITLLSDKKTVEVETGRARPQLNVMAGRGPELPNAPRRAEDPAAPEQPHPTDTHPDAPVGTTFDPAVPAHDLTPAGLENMPELSCGYPASMSSEVFHKADCGNAARISPTNLICYQTREQAIAAGKRPAGCCHP